MDTINISKNAIDCEILKNLKVTQENFQHAGHCKLAISMTSAQNTTRASEKPQEE